MNIMSKHAPGGNSAAGMALKSGAEKWNKRVKCDRFGGNGVGLGVHIDERRNLLCG